MKQYLIFNPSRAWQLLQNDLRTHTRQFLMAVFAILAVLAFFGIISIDESGTDTELHYWLYPISLVIFGCVLTGYAFKEMWQPQERQFYLSLPASHLEKFSVRWFITVIGFPIMYTLIYLAFSKFYDWYALKMGHEMLPYSPFQRRQVIFFSIYGLVQSLFLLGAIWFRKYNQVKTLALLFVAALANILLFLIFFRIIFADAFPDGGLLTEPSIELRANAWLKYFWKDVVVDWGQAFVFWVVPPLLWLVTYLKLTEKEA